MRISADFTVVPDDFAKAAAPEYRVDGIPVVSFPFYIDEIKPGARYLHWEFVDPDSIPVCGFEWIHWSVANLPIDALMYDFNDSHALAIPPDFSRQLPAMIPEAVQGRNSSASKFLGRASDPAVTMRYNGPQPPDKDHEYYLQVWATEKPLPGLNQGFWLNELLHALRGCGEAPDSDGIFLTGRA
ncbi:YbhB/YbcL family Raf kinase inhibitor-like protein [Bifidobacterium vespertilionis]|uniref:YbhB/YbcL family Raf kinase inhibitor-like protein n=1 Tax=Bifidobacterium vespertilionis TaxID=2562524 RepID=A0A5J5DVM0_9BIFI|nr:YbhB/YbcL family Raf kinase inhibitor-like protein [Bifidobacterium vespertilionis]KAA8820938.1 YbhB/YbcL family Raf kinase inhibitor-like protein [Bifidobacterium vespertilionis]KAA8822760.1 YbhB/YbcL family Raf kinase inhibitor-like protein [Bifidobacterium vespertilionis]